MEDFNIGEDGVTIIRSVSAFYNREHISLKKEKKQWESDKEKMHRDAENRRKDIKVLNMKLEQAELQIKLLKQECRLLKKLKTANKKQLKALGKRLAETRQKIAEINQQWIDDLKHILDEDQLAVLKGLKRRIRIYKPKTMQHYQMFSARVKKNAYNEFRKRYKNLCPSLRTLRRHRSKIKIYPKHQPLGEIECFV